MSWNRPTSLVPLLCLGLLPHAPASAEDQPLAEYFQAEVERISAEPLLGIGSLQEWKEHRPELQRRLRSMIGLDPLPERTDLAVEIRGISEQPEFVVERLLYQSSPGLYVTANLYRPKTVDKPLPAVLYLCGHANVVRDGVIYGNKAHYQHHAAWYAANGYVCLIVDTLQLGEVPGLHHGTYREGKWWWQTRGYTPAGVEVWNAIRAIDYLQSRPEVDPDRIGVTGRSGGGAISWYLGAVDDRLAAVIPVAGITDLHDHLIEGGPTGDFPNGVIEGHCDCMFLVNTDRWDFDTVAALVAPKAMLVENTDRDRIFPEAGVRRIYEQLEKVYGWYDATEKLDLVIGEGGHVDSEEIRHPSFAFMNTWLKGEPTDPADIEEPDRTVPIEELKVLGVDEAIPADARNASIDETFIPTARAPSIPTTGEELQGLRERWLDQIRAEVVRGWPTEEEAGPIDAEVAFDRELVGFNRVVRAIDFQAQPGVRLRAYLSWSAEAEGPGLPTDVFVIGDENWEAIRPWIDLFEAQTDPAQQEALRRQVAVIEDPEALKAIGQEDPFSMMFLSAFARGKPTGELPTVAIVVPRGIGPTSWQEGRQDIHIRRRFALIGQTLDGMRAWDVRRALLALLKSGDWPIEQAASPRFRLMTWGQMAPVALLSAAFEPESIVGGVLLIGPPSSVEAGPALLNLSRVLDLPQAVTLPGPRRVAIIGHDPEVYFWAIEVAREVGPTAGPWFPPVPSP